MARRGDPPVGDPGEVRYAPAGRVRLVWMLLARGDVFALLPAPVAAAALAVAAVAMNVPAVLAVLVAGVAAGEWRARRRLRPLRGVRVTAGSQPELLALVADTAAALGRRPPARVWLTAGPNAMTLPGRLPGRRGELYLGVPVLLALDVDESRAIVAHELAHLDEPGSRLLGRLLDQRRTAADQWERRAARAARRGRPRSPLWAWRSRRLERFLSRTRRLAVEEELRADAASARVVDTDVAARALATVYAAGDRFTGYLLRCVSPLVRSGRYPAEPYAGWSTWCAEPPFFYEEFMAAALAEEDDPAGAHPALAERIRAFRGTGGGDPAASPVPLVPLVPRPGSVLRPLDAAGELRLGRTLAMVRPELPWWSRLRNLRTRPRPVSWGEVSDGSGPDAVPSVAAADAAYFGRADRDFCHVLTSATAELLGRPATPSDVVDAIVAGRAPRLRRILGARLAGPDEPNPVESVPDASLLGCAVSVVLRGRGHRCLGPLEQHVLVSPEGIRTDLPRVCAALLAGLAARPFLDSDDAPNSDGNTLV